MSRRSSFEIEQSSPYATSVYSKIIKEIEAKEVPPKYIDHVYVQFKNGTTIDVDGCDISETIILANKPDWSALEDDIHKVHSVKIYLNMKALELHVEKEIDRLFGDKLIKL